MLRVACDLDGTVADMESALQREVQQLFGPAVDLRATGVAAESLEARREGADSEAAANAQEPVASVRHPATDGQLRELWAHIRGIDNFWTTLDEIEPGALARFSALAALHRWDVVFITHRSRTRGDTVQRQSQRWLEAHNFDHPSVFVMKGPSRGRLADAMTLDAVIDDRPENCLDVATDSKARPFLVWRDDPAAVPAAASRFGISVVSSLAQALDELEMMMAVSAKPRGFVGRVRAAIGI